MTVRSNFVALSGKLFVTYCTVYYGIVLAGVYTVRLYSVFYNSSTCGMSECGDFNRLSGALSITVNTVYYAIIATGIYTVGLNAILFYSLAVNVGSK